MKITAERVESHGRRVGSMSVTMRAAMFATLILEAGNTLAQAPAPVGAAVTAVHCGHLIDTEAGKLLGATTVLIEAGRVRSINAGVQAPSGATEIDLAAATCL